MKKPLLLATFALSCLAQQGQITHLPITTADDMPGTEVQFYKSAVPVSLYRVHLECDKPSGERIKMSRLIDYYTRQTTGNVLFSAKFETGVCTVKKIRIVELAPTKEQVATY